jgi:hypothetical protein
MMPQFRPNLFLSRIKLGAFPREIILRHATEHFRDGSLNRVAPALELAFADKSIHPPQKAGIDRKDDLSRGHTSSIPALLRCQLRNRAIYRRR